MTDKRYTTAQSFRLMPEDRFRLKEMAYLNRVSQAELVRRLINEEWERIEKPKQDYNNEIPRHQATA